jgi:hypothetical protein
MATSEGNFRQTARAYLAAIDRYNGKTNAILTKLEELAMEQAAMADEAENEANGWGCSTVSASRSRTAYTSRDTGPCMVRRSMPSRCRSQIPPWLPGCVRRERSFSARVFYCGTREK